MAFFTLYSSHKAKFQDVNDGIEHKFVVVLKKGFKPDELSKLLINNNYFSDPKDANVIAQHISDKLNEKKKTIFWRLMSKILPPKFIPEEEIINLGALNLSRFRIEADSAEIIGGEALKMQTLRSQEILHGDVNMDSLYSTFHPNIKDIEKGDCAITVKVQEKNEKASWLDKLRKNDSHRVDGVIVQLKEHYWITTGVDKTTKDSIYVAIDTIIGYATTNKEGIAVFKGLRKDGYFSVLPVKKSFEYGSSKGTSAGKSLGENHDYSFTQKAHKIRLIDPLTYSQIKEDSTVIVRTPQDYIDSLVKYMVLFFLVWWDLHFYLFYRKKETDPLILPLLMTLTGICLVIMYAIHNPLADKMLGRDMAIGIIIGVILIVLLSEVNFAKFVNSQSGFKINKKQVTIPFDLPMAFLRGLLRFRVAGRKIYPLGIKTYQSVCKIPDGFGYLLLALLLALSLFPFGAGPEGSGVKVNLFFFQPSEITKYLIVLFLATFFAHRAAYFSKITNLKKRIINISIIAAGIGILLGIYILLGDMGPALVLALTFIIIYSMARRDFPQLLLGSASFAVLLWVSSKFFGGSTTILATFALLWFVLWIAYGMTNKKQIFESAIFLNLIIAAFIFGENIPNVGERLHDRNAIYTNLWNNDVIGGDQVVQGLWGLASGGTFGQGLGKGNPNLVPAFHTDMIFTSIGEELGGIGLLLIILCLAILLHRSLLIGRRAAQPFLFYLAVGIAIVTGVQFLIITLGSVGVIPLTGIAVPFLSYGKVSLILNLAAFGIVLSISQIRGSNLQKEDTTKRYDTIIRVGSMAYTFVSLLLLGVLAYYQFFTRNTTLVKPAFVATQQGERMIEYNPRINLLMKNLDAGIIYDRNGLILATNSVDSITANVKKFTDAGVIADNITKESKKHKQRYYPFGSNMFFWTGDFNSKLLWDEGESARGYIAERRHLAYLRGVEISHTTEILPTKLTGRFLDEKSIDKKLIVYQYPDLIVDMLKDGINGDIVKEHNEKRAERDITLTVDAALQTKLQNELNNYVKDPQNNFSDKNGKIMAIWNKLRISVVILNASNGDLLCSANYPLPDQSILKNMPNVYNEKDRNQEAYTDQDLGMTYQTPPGSTAKVMSALAGLQKLGMSAASKTYFIDPREVIEKYANGVPIEPTGNAVTMEQAIRKSSNNYFINLVNDKGLYIQLDSIYSTVGIRLDKGLGRRRFEALIPYTFNYDNINNRAVYQTEVLSVGSQAMNLYNNYVRKRNADRNNNAVYQTMGWHEARWAWGQGSMSATPLSMARVASIVANNGTFVETQYIAGKELRKKMKIEEPKQIPIVSADAAQELKQYMKNESGKHRENGHNFPVDLNMGGKTGTPERELHYKAYNTKTNKLITTIYKRNDGWYIFFIDSKKNNQPLAVAVRMERLGAGISGNAVKLTDKVVINKVLTDLGYIYSMPFKL
ncbi:hypothetical protein FACS189426_18810 [Bacteroidia bacterium]|nr:hypothetical protein FACS189426_18810 [Bacteroidia bacterium]